MACVYNLYIVSQNGYCLYLSYRKGGLAKFLLDLVAYKVTVESFGYFGQERCWSFVSCYIKLGYSDLSQTYYFCCGLGFSSNSIFQRKSQLIF